MIDSFAFSEVVRKLANLIRIGKISEIDGNQVKVRIGRATTGWLPIISTAGETYVGAKTYSPFEAFNGVVSDSSSWEVKNQSGWIQIELPAPDICNYLRIGGTFSNEEPESFVLSASNDGENYIELLNSGPLSWKHNELKEWPLENSTAYKFYKIEAVNTRSAYVGFSEIQLMEHMVTREY